MHSFATSGSGGGGVFDALLSSSDDKLLGGSSLSHAPGAVAASAVARRLPEPYERHRAHDLRAECYRRGLRPVKKGPHANDNKHGYVQLLRQSDASGGGGGSHSSSNSSSSANSVAANEAAAIAAAHATGDDDDGAATPDDALPPLRSKPSAGASVDAGSGAAAAAAVADLSAFYESAPLVPPLPAAYAAAKSPQAGGGGGSSAAVGGGSGGSATDLEILSGIANTYTQNGAGDAQQLCGSCRTVVSDQLMESIRLGRNKMQLLEAHRVAEQRDRDTTHLKEVLGALLDLRRAHREAQLGGGASHDLLLELEDDIAFFRALKERTKARMRLAMLAGGPRERGSNQTTDAS